ncbi:MAG: DNA uptake protein ComE-like DNA-binding protein [Myxococcota bacterium]|jgi:DNA uptake protein ComE-like DNA-binding protein
MIRLLSTLFAVSLVACGAPAENIGDSWGDADYALSRVLSEADQSVVLLLANTASFDLLDDEVGLDARAAAGIVSNRPFSSISALDRVSYVGPSALDKMVEYAEANPQEAPEAEVPDRDPREVFGVMEGTPLADGILHLVNTASLETLDDDVGLHATAARNIVERRAAGRLTNLVDLDRISYVGASAFDALVDYVESTVPDLMDDPDADPCGDVVMEGTVRVRTVAEAVSLQGVTRLTGDLIIDGSDRHTLRGLEELRCVDGDVVITDNHHLTDVEDLGELHTIGGDLVLGNHPRMNSAQMVVEHIGGDFRWYMRSASGDGSFPDLLTIGGDVTLAGGSVPPLTNITELHGDLSISSSSSSLPSFRRLQSIAGSLTLRSARLEEMNAFNSLTWVGSHLSIVENASLTDIDGFSRLEEIGSTLSVQSNPELASLDGFAQLQTVGGLQVVNNAELWGIPGLESLHTVRSGLILRDLTMGRVTLEVEHVGGSVIIERCDLGGNPLKRLLTLGGGFRVAGGSMGGTGGTMPLTSVNGSIYLDNDGNPSFDHVTSAGNLTLHRWSNSFNALETVSGTVGIYGDSDGPAGSMSGFDRLDSIGGSLLIRAEGFPNIRGFDALQSIGNNFEIYRHRIGDGGVSSVTGFDSLTSVGGNIGIRRNDMTNIRFLYGLTYLGGDLVLEEYGVSECEMLEFADDLAFDAGFTGETYLYGYENCR